MGLRVVEQAWSLGFKPVKGSCRHRSHDVKPFDVPRFQGASKSWVAPREGFLAEIGRLTAWKLGKIGKPCAKSQNELAVFDFDRISLRGDGCCSEDVRTSGPGSILPAGRAGEPGQRIRAPLEDADAQVEKSAEIFLDDATMRASICERFRSRHGVGGAGAGDPAGEDVGRSAENWIVRDLTPTL